MLLTRDDDGAVHAFANTCRHRGHELLPCGGSATPPSSSAPTTRGRTVSTEISGRRPASRRPGFEVGECGLNELPAVEWQGLIFVDGSGGPRRWTTRSAPWTRSSRRTRGAAGDRRTHEYDATANWKILTENYHECYHCPSIHPELCKVSPPKSGENYASAGTWVGGWMDLRDGMATMSLDGTSRGVPLRGLDEQGLRTVIYVNVFPNVLLSLHPDYVMMHRLMPLAADRTRIECTWAFAPEASRGPGSTRATRWTSGT